MSEKITLAAMEPASSSEAKTTLASLFDEESFVELSAYAGAKGGSAGVITGYGQVNGDLVYGFMQDASVRSGAVSVASAEKIKKVYELAVKNGAPVVAIYDGKGGDITEGSALLGAYGKIAAASAKLSGVAPQIAVITGVCGGTNATLACMADFVIMTEKAEFFLTAPFVADDKTAGAGSSRNAEAMGIACRIAADTASAVKSAQQLLSVLPKNNLDVGGNDYFQPLETTASADLKGADMIKALCDKDSMIELYSGFGKASLTAFASVNWKTVGFVATNKANAKLNKDDCAKIARFVSFCDAFSIPVVTVADTEGFEASNAAELQGAVRDAAKLTQAYAGATCPKITFITGNAIGGAFTAFCGENADVTIALESAIIAPMTPKAAAVFLFADELKDKTALDAKAEEYAAEAASPFTACGCGVVDRVVAPENAALAIESAIESLSGKRVIAPARKHINWVY